MRAQILTPWTQDEEGGNHPLIDEALANHKGWRWTDVTAQPVENLSPDPNLYVIELECDAATLAAIEADRRFYVIWSDNA